MAVYSIVKLSELEGAKRIDAEYYKPEYLNLLYRLRKAGCVPAKDIAIPVRRKFKPKKGEYFDYIEISEVDLITGEFNTSRIIGEEAPDRAQWIVVKDDVLVSTVRPIRNAVVLIREGKENLVCSSGFSILHPQKIQANYLFLYFKNSFVARLLDRYTTATEYPAVGWNDILNMPIYLGNEGFRKKISLTIDKAFVLLKQSRSLYSQAENLLLEELGLKDFKPAYKKTYTANLSDAFSAHRINAEYFQPAYEEILSIISKKHNLVPVKKVFDFRRGIFIPTDFYTEQKTNRPYIRIKELTGKIGIDESKVIFVNYEYPENDIDKLCENDLVIAIIGDTIGKTNRIPNELAGGFCSNNTGRLRIKPEIKEKFLPEFAEILFQSLVVQKQIEKKKAQTGQPKISDSDIKSLKIPILPFETQQKIASLVRQSHEARKKAIALLDEAKRRVEEEIENQAAL